MRILAIETSCDETAIAIAEFSGPRSHPRISVLSNIVSSQTEIHQKFGGVVPNLARREHERNLAPILLTAAKEAKLRNSNFQFPISKQIQPRISTSAVSTARRGENEIAEVVLRGQNSKIQNIEKILEREPELLKQFKKHILSIAPPEIDALAVTHGPGLAPALWVGVNFARALSVLWKKPLIPVNHMSGHLYSSLLQPAKKNSKFEIRNSKQIPNPKSQIQNIQFPAVAVLVSGGHTELILMRGHGKWKIVGETRDDAAGEAFDKVARILGLPYPGGPALSALAESGIADKHGQEKSRTNTETNNGPRKSAHTESPRMSALRLPRPMIHSNDFDFSFSGLKTAVLYLARDLGAKQTKQLRPRIAKEFQDAVIDVLVKKTIRAAKIYKAKTVLLGGGVAANRLLREKLYAACLKELSDVRCRSRRRQCAHDRARRIFYWKEKSVEQSPRGC